MRRSVRFRTWNSASHIMSDALEEQNRGADTEIMLSIGLCDKEGTELFEGDICEGELKLGCMSGEKRGTIVYNKEFARYDLKFADGTAPLGFVTNLLCVGNIYLPQHEASAVAL